MNTITKITANAHTHTTFCDGTCSVEEMVEKAICEGFHCLGFSGHSYTWFEKSYAMSQENERLYRQEILSLKEKYKDQIDIVLGAEVDGLADDVEEGVYDYVIGSCHHMYSPELDRHYTVDYTIEELERCKNEAFGGDGMAMVKAYFEMMTDMVSKRKPDIAGHMDLIRKLNAGNRFFDETSEEYLQLAKACAKACVENDCIIEINTGGVYRRYRNTPYPAEPLLRYIAEPGGKVTINSDAHNTEALNYMFPQALDLMRRCGFKTVWQLTGEGFREFEI